MNKDSIKAILNLFSIRGNILNTTILQSGYINKTYLIEVEGGHRKRLILQSINTAVFPQVGDLMDNVLYTCRHIDERLQSGDFDFVYTNLHFYTTKEGLPFIHYGDDYFRLLDFIPHQPLETGEITTAVAAEAGKTLGHFHLLIHRMNPEKVVEVIPDFHRLDLRFEHLLAIDTADNPRFTASKDFYEKVLGFKYLVDEFRAIIRDRTLPLRVVHNDPKLSNMLFDESGVGITMIDLDTVMPGFLGNDFGDAIRSLANTAGENEPDLERVHFDDRLYENFAKAYLDTVRRIISLREREYLSRFVLFITFEQLIRFYADYLQNDVYYPVSYPTQNLQRAKVQWKLLREMEGYCHSSTLTIFQ